MKYQQMKKRNVLDLFDKLDVKEYTFETLLSYHHIMKRRHELKLMEFVLALFQEGAVGISTNRVEWHTIITKA